MNIALVLAGGMAKGAYQVGVLKALREYLSPVDIRYFSSASIGALNTCAYMYDRLDVAEDIWLKICSEKKKVYLNRLVQSDFVQRTVKDLCKLGNGFKKDFFVPLLDLTNRAIEYTNFATLSKEILPSYLRASVAIPILNESVEINGKYYLDGGFGDIIPVYPLLDLDLDYVICVYFDDCCYTFEEPEFDKKVIKVTFPAKRTLRDSLVFQQDVIEEMFDEGYDHAKEVFDRVFVKGIDDLPFILHTIEEMNNEYKEKKLRLTIDVMATGLNKVMTQIAKRNVSDIQQ